MTENLLRVTLTFPTELEDVVTDALLDLLPPLGGFTTTKVDGHGFSFENAAAAELVRGRIERCQLQMVIEHGRLDEVLGCLRTKIKFDHGTWWAEKIEGFGRL